MTSPDRDAKINNVSPETGHDDENNAVIIKSTIHDKNKYEKNSNKPRSPKLFKIMLHLVKEFIIMVLVAVTYAVLTKDSPPKIGKSPAAYPFFENSLHISDWYRGDISQALSVARASDISFVMFYAPWNAESQHARKEFDAAAKLMHDEVTFAAINCWQPGSECKMNYFKVYRWPVLIAYPTHGRGIQYNGPLIGSHMVKFLKSMIHPVVRVTDKTKLRGQHDVVVLAEMCASPYSLHYISFYLTALKMLEKDHLQDFVFAIRTQSELDSDGNANIPIIYLQLWNETLIYPQDREWRSESILTWIINHTHQVTTWLSPSGGKSLVLSSYISNNPSLILFLPRNPLSFHHDIYSMFREIGYEYYNCDESTVTDTIQNEIREQRVANYHKYLEIVERCQHSSIPSHARISVDNLYNLSYCSFKSRRPTLSQCDSFGRSFESTVSYCSSSDRYATSMITESNDKYNSKYLKQYHWEENCKIFKESSKFMDNSFFSSHLQSGTNYEIKGLACKGNKSLSLIAMDSLQYYHFAEKLGVDLKRFDHRSTAVILDDRMESHYILNQPLNEITLRKFIYNFSQNALSRALNSTSGVLSHNTHSYGNLNCTKDKNIFCIQELDSNTFLPTIMIPHKSVLVFYYSKQCAFCNGIASNFLTVAKTLKSVRNLLFTRIDGDLNLLPWEFTMESYPTILFVPSFRKSESRVFPKDLPITVPNLVGFILSNLEPTSKLSSMWSICKQQKFAYEKDICLSTLRIQLLNIVEKTLREWRLCSIRRRQDILRKLQHLKHLHLLLAHSSTNDAVDKQFKILLQQR